MTHSDFEAVLQVVASNPGRTAKEIANTLRDKVDPRFTTKLVNQTLYRLLTASLVQRSIDDKPKWSIGETISAVASPGASRAQPQRPLMGTSLAPERDYMIAETRVRVLLDQSLSPNDHYLIPDWVGSHVIATVNCRHPFWTVRVTSPEHRALYCMLAAVDAFTQWKAAQLTRFPDPSEILEIRDRALRFCTLPESEGLTLE